MKTKYTRLTLLLLLSMLGTMIGSSCRTFRGFGQDVEHAGNHIERAAR